MCNMQYNLSFERMSLFKFIRIVHLLNKFSYIALSNPIVDCYSVEKERLGGTLSSALTSNSEVVNDSLAPPSWNSN